LIVYPLTPLRFIHYHKHRPRLDYPSATYTPTPYLQSKISCKSHFFLKIACIINALHLNYGEILLVAAADAHLHIQDYCY
jgi:hypothetical protein